MFAFDAWLCRHIRGHSGREGLVDGDGLETGQPARSLAVALRPLQVGVLRCRWFLLGLGMAEPENEARRRQKHQTSLPRFDHRCLPVNVLWLDQTRLCGRRSLSARFRQRLLRRDCTSGRESRFLESYLGLRDLSAILIQSTNGLRSISALRT